MSRRIVLICCLLSLTAALSAARAQQDDARPAPTPRAAMPSAFRFSAPAAAGPVCTAGEKRCAIGGAITWCCRADQQCNYAYPGGCR